MIRVVFFLFFFSYWAGAQNRFIAQVYRDENHQKLVAAVTEVEGVRVVLNLDYPGSQTNAVAIILDPPPGVDLEQLVDAVRTRLGQEYDGLGKSFFFGPDPSMSSYWDDGAGGTSHPLTLTTGPDSVQSSLDDLVPRRPLESVVSGVLSGDILVDVVGTGVDEGHPELGGLNFVHPSLSVVTTTSGGSLEIVEGDFDFHNHETRLVGCMAGINTGLLTALGTRTNVKFRSGLCYEMPTSFPSIEPVTTASLCVAGIQNVISAHKIRLLTTPYLRNHGAVLCFAHSVGVEKMRVRPLEAALDSAWENGIVTSISAGNLSAYASSMSPAGVGEWISYTEDGVGKVTRLWPPDDTSLYTSYTVPSSAFYVNECLDEVAGEMVECEGVRFHIKSGTYDFGVPKMPWVASGGVGTSWNTLAAPEFGEPVVGAVDVFLPGVTVNVPATIVNVGSGPDSRVVGGTSLVPTRGYQTVSGTSYSAAFSAAIAVRILQLRPWASPSQVREALIGSGGGTGFNKIVMPDFAALDPMPLTYDEWIERHRVASPFLFSSGTNLEQSADPDGDGVSNVMEYFCGMDPRFQDAQHAPVVGLSADRTTFDLEMQVAEYLPSTGGTVVWQFQTSPDLETWTDAGQGTVTVLPHTGANGDGRTHQASLPVTTDLDARFYRVKMVVGP